MIAYVKCAKKQEIEAYTEASIASQGYINTIFIRFNDNLLLCAVYSSPGVSRSLLKENIKVQIEKFARNDEDVLIVGDFNHRKYATSLCESLNAIRPNCKELKLHGPLNDYLTDIDFALSDKNLFFSSYETPFSDHRTLILDDFCVVNLPRIHSSNLSSMLKNQFNSSSDEKSPEKKPPSPSSQTSPKRSPTHSPKRKLSPSSSKGTSDTQRFSKRREHYELSQKADIILNNISRIFFDDLSYCENIESLQISDWHSFLASEEDFINSLFIKIREMASKPWNEVPVENLVEINHIQYDVVIPHCLNRYIKFYLTTGDGSCFYHACSIAISGSERWSTSLRLLCLDICRRHELVLSQDRFSGNFERMIIGLAMTSQFLNSIPVDNRKKVLNKIDPSRDDLWANINWANDSNFYPMAEVLQRPIHMFTPGRNIIGNTLADYFARSPSYYNLGYTTRESQKNRPPICIGNNPGTHFIGGVQCSAFDHALPFARLCPNFDAP